MDKLVGLCGSLRRASLNRKLMQNAITHYGDCDFQELDLNIPLFNGDIQDMGMPAQITAMAHAIKSADGIVIAAPEYNKAISGVLKNAMDWISRVPDQAFAGKPVVLLTAAAGRTGGETGQYYTRHCLTPLGADVITTPGIYIAGAANEFNADGVIENDRYRANLTAIMQELKRRIGQNRL